jgi:hypothetical protein
VLKNISSDWPPNLGSIVHWSLCSNSLQTAPGREKLFYFISKFRLYSICFLEMNDVDFEEVRSLFQNEDKKGLLVLSEQIFKQINSAKFVSTSDLLARMRDNCLGRNHQAEMLIPRRIFQKTKRCMAIR